MVRSFSWIAVLAIGRGPVGAHLTRMESTSAATRLARLLRILGVLDGALLRARILCAKACTLSARDRHAGKVSQVIDLLLDHFRGLLRIDEVVQAVGLPRATLCRYFRR